MLTLPVPTTNVPAGDSQEGLGGTSDSTAVALPDRFGDDECTVFLEFVFNVLP